jgi:hypothetical protein
LGLSAATDAEPAGADVSPGASQPPSNNTIHPIHSDRIAPR